MMLRVVNSHRPIAAVVDLWDMRPAVEDGAVTNQDMDGHISMDIYLFVCVCVSVCVRTCVPACVGPTRACGRVCVRACACAPTMVLSRRSADFCFHALIFLAVTNDRKTSQPTKISSSQSVGILPLFSVVYPI